MWPGKSLKLIDRTTFYESINQGSDFTWPDDFKRDDPDRAAALKKAKDTAQNLKDSFVACKMPNFPKVAKDSYSIASSLLHQAYVYNRRSYVML